MRGGHDGRVDRRLDMVAGGQLEWRASAALAASSELGAVPNLAGIWGEASVRMRRWIRQSVQQVQQGDQRLNDILSALQASPNGVVLLDAQGRIEWCNQISAKQFGFDAERDVLQSIGNLVRDPQFSAYFAAQDFSHDLVMQGRESTPSRPVKLSVQLYGYGEGRKLLLARDDGAGAGRSHAPRLRGQCLARNPHAFDRAGRFCRDPAEPAA
jgi:hypothetical protein